MLKTIRYNWCKQETHRNHSLVVGIGKSSLRWISGIIPYIFNTWLFIPPCSQYMFVEWSWKIEDLPLKMLWSIQLSVTTLQYFAFVVSVWPSPHRIWLVIHRGGCVAKPSEVYSSWAPMHILGFFSEFPCCLECNIYTHLAFLRKWTNDSRLTDNGWLFPSLSFMERSTCTSICLIVEIG